MSRPCGNGRKRAGSSSRPWTSWASMARRSRTWQIGDGGALAKALGVRVVNDLRIADVEAGGQGAPLVPVYHAALAHDLPKPLAVANVGGVANVTWIGATGELLSFDTGPGNAPIDDWCM